DPPVSIHDDFFNDLGGDSLQAAKLISALRDQQSTASITVRDLYESRTVAALASRARAAEALGEASPAREDEPRRRERCGRQRVGSQRRPLVATVVQMLWLLTGLALGSSAAYFVAYHVFPSLLRRLGVVRLMLVGPPIVFVALVVYMPIAVLVAAVIKKVL